MDIFFQIIPISILIMAVTLMVPCLLHLIIESAKSANISGCVRFHRFTLLLSLLSGMGTTALLFIAGYQYSDDATRNAAAAVFCLPFVLMEVISCLAFVNYRIEYDDCGFSYRNMLRLRRTYLYDDIQGIIEDKYNARLVMKRGNKLSIPVFSIGRKGFMKEIEQWRNKNGLSPTKLPSFKDSLFNGNVYDAEGLYACWILFITVVGSWLAGTAIIAIPKGDYQIIIIIGSFLTSIVLFGLFFNYVISNAERYPKIASVLVKKSYIKNPIVREKLGLKSTVTKRKRK